MSDGPKVTWNERDRAWYFRYRRADNTRNSKSVPKEIQDARGAQAWANRWVAVFRRNGGKPPTWEVKVPATPHKTIADLSETWLRFRRDHPRTGPNTYDQFKTNMNAHILPHPIARRPIVDLSPHELAKWMKGVASRVAPNTAGNVCWSLTEFFKDVRGQDWGIPLPLNPMKDEIVRAEVPRRVNLAGKGNVIHLTAEQAATLLAAGPDVVPAHRHSRHAFELYTGAREGETSGLAWKHLYLDVAIPYVDVERQLLENLEFAAPKKNSFRQIPLHPRLIAILSEWRVNGWPFQFGRSPTYDDPVWPATRGRREGTYYRPASGRRLRSDLRAVGLSDTFKGHDIDAHALRRTFATLLDDAGVSPNRLGPLLGHAGKTVTDRNYIGRNLRKFLPSILAMELEVDGVVNPP